MDRDDLIDLNAFLAICDAGGFTRAAARLGVSQSALSHAMRRLEERVGVRLLARTTRSVAPTDAGERLLASIRPGLEEIGRGLASVGDLRDRPAGKVRINAQDQAIESIVWPRLARVLGDYPDIEVELTAEIGMIDIVAKGYDAGVRIGEQVARDMIAVRIGPEMRMAVVGSPAYFERHPRPRVPQDLAAHACINLRLPTLGGIYAWEFEKRGREVKVRVNGRFVFNNPALMLPPALEGFGLAYVLEDRAAPWLATGELVRVLEDWCDPYPGYHLYYPSRRQQSPAFAVVVAALREPH